MKLQLKRIRDYRLQSSEIIASYMGGKREYHILVVPLSGDAEPYAVANYTHLLRIGANAQLGNIILENSHATLRKTSGVYPPEKVLKRDKPYKVICVDHEKRDSVVEALRGAIRKLKEEAPIVDALYIAAVEDLFSTTIDD